VIAYRCLSAPLYIANANQAQHDQFGMDPKQPGTLVSIHSNSGGQYQTGLYYDFFRSLTSKDNCTIQLCH
jgi:membrane-bound inhibitor of C-type lysozyme